MVTRKQKRQVRHALALHRQFYALAAKAHAEQVADYVPRMRLLSGNFHAMMARLPETAQTLVKNHLAIQAMLTR